MEYANQWQKERHENAIRLQSELIHAGFMATRIEEPSEKTGREEYAVIYFDGTRDYKISRDYRGLVSLHRDGYERYENVSPYTRGEVYKKHRGNNVKVITSKAVQRLIDATNAYEDEMRALNDSATDKADAFIKEVQAIEAKGIKVRWTRADWKDKNTKIVGGYVERNGIEFSFTISQDGHIGKSLDVRVDSNSLENFIALSDNKYRV